MAGLVAGALLAASTAAWGQGYASSSVSAEAGASAAAPAQAVAAGQTPFSEVRSGLPFEMGVLVQGGSGLTENRDGFKFLMAGVHAGKVLTPDFGKGFLRGDFEYAVEVFPFWQSYTPTFQRANCVATSTLNVISCSPLYTTGGTYTGASVTPIILRWNFKGKGRLVPWAQAAGGLLWTNHKYPAFGQGPSNLGNDGPNTDASVFNFTPQGGVGVHWFVRPNRSIDFGANGIHISSASLGDKNPGVNASVQFNVGYTFWK
jgi:lipid A 3-O-deacylase